MNSQGGPGDLVLCVPSEQAFALCSGTVLEIILSWSHVGYTVQCAPHYKTMGEVILVTENKKCNLFARQKSGLEASSSLRSQLLEINSEQRTPKTLFWLALPIPTTTAILSCKSFSCP